MDSLGDNLAGKCVHSLFFFKAMLANIVVVVVVVFSKAKNMKENRDNLQSMQNFLSR